MVRDERNDEMVCFKTYELYFPTSVPERNLVHTGWSAVFQNQETHSEWTVPGFWDGDGIRIRFLPPAEGTYNYKVHADGILRASGKVLCRRDAGYHGPVRTEGCHFVYADGTLYRPFGTTCYALLYQDDALVQTTMQSLVASPFNKLRLCLFPKYYAYTRNEPSCFPFERREDGTFDVTHPCVPFWQKAERILDELQENGIEADLILFHPYDRWGFASMSPEEDKTYLSYLLARFAARPGIWWSLANEFDLCREKTMKDFEELEEFISAEDPYHHLLSCHSFFANWDASRPGITHLSLQRKAVEKTAVWEKKYAKPVVVDECGYEGNIPESFGCYSPEVITDRYWKCCTMGGYMSHGETFLESGREDAPVFWSRGGTLKGQSIPRIGFLKSILEKIGAPLSPLSDPMTEGLFPDGREALLQQIAVDDREGKREEAAFLQAVLACSREELLEVREGNMDFRGHAGGDAFLFYFGEHAYPSYTYTLPEGRNYRVILLNPWEMTETMVMKHAFGTVTVPLPGKPRMALLYLCNQKDEGT